MKLDWKKTDKAYYLPPNEPRLVQVPPFRFFAIRGQGDPNDPAFQEYMEVLYALSYSIKMSPKSGTAPEGYMEYTVFPLEGVWDISEEARKRGAAGVSKSDYVFDLMIRQPDFVTEGYARAVVGRVGAKKSLPLLARVRFEVIEEGDCVQMTHVGPYDAEPASFARMERFCADHSLKRQSMVHREIYLSDPRKTSPEKMRTVLRFQITGVR